MLSSDAAEGYTSERQGLCCIAAEALDLRDGSRLPKTAVGRAFLRLLVCTLLQPQLQTQNTVCQNVCQLACLPRAPESTPAFLHFALSCTLLLCPTAVCIGVSQLIYGRSGLHTWVNTWSPGSGVGWRGVAAEQAAVHGNIAGRPTLHDGIILVLCRVTS